ncbi:MAG: hypothetical protein B6D68_01765 [spirochete symbiont of Stewartia floridana]|nr:MAG: hypothetical protein B6D68_01765 [spirochete symbiont of Stewartia floridana]
MLSGSTLGRPSIPDRAAMAGLDSKNGMTLLYRLVWFTAAHQQFAEAAGQDIDHLFPRRRWAGHRCLGYCSPFRPGGKGRNTQALSGRLGILRGSPPLVRIGVLW